MKFNYKKKYGQNFLKDEKTLKKIRDSLFVHKKDLIIEIGPGSGNLTKYLKELNIPIIAYEVDEDTKSFLNRIEDNNCKIVYEDFLKANILDNIEEHEYNSIHIVANIPYYITNPILKKIINEEFIDDATILLQKEVAERICAIPGTKQYGFLTVFINYYMDSKLLFNVKNDCFFPKPKVDSSVIYLKRKRTDSIINEEKLWELVEASFQFKRKNLRNNLKKYNLEKIERALNKYNLSIVNRAEDIPLNVFIEIYNSLFN